MSKPHINIIFLIWIICFNGWAQNENNISSKTSHDLALDVELGYRYYYDEPSYDQQKSHFPTLAISPKFSLEWKDSSESLNFEGFFRLDLDKERTHWDIRELYYQKIKDTPGIA